MTSCLRTSCIGSWSRIMLFFGCINSLISHGLTRLPIHFSWKWSWMIIRSIGIGCRYGFLDSKKMINIAEFRWRLRFRWYNIRIRMMIMWWYNILKTLPRIVIILRIIKILNIRLPLFFLTHLSKYNNNGIISITIINSWY